MKGTVRSWDDSKGFGHTRPEGGGKEVFLHYSALDSADDRKLLGPGAEVEFELEDPEPKKGPKAKSVKVLTQGQPAGGAGKSTPTAATGAMKDVLPDIEAVVPLDPGSDGYFRMPVTTRKKGKPAQRSFRIAGNTTFTVWVPKEGSPEMQRADPNLIQTSKKGLIEIAIEIGQAPQATLKLVLDNGISQTIDLVK